MYQQVVDITTGSEVALDSSVFTLDTTTSSPTSTLSFSTTNVSKLGVYTLRLKVGFSSSMLASHTNVDRDFTVELVDPCPTATLTIDDTILKTPPTVTLSEYIG